MAMLQATALDPRDRRLLSAFALVGFTILSLGGVFALLMKLVRTPALSVLPAQTYYQSLTGHGVLMFIFWLGFIQTAFLIVAGTVLVRRPLWSYKMGWAGLGIMTLAASLALVAVLRGTSVTYNVPVPLSQQFQGTSLVLLSYILLAIGMGVVVVDFILTMLAAVENKRSLNCWAAFFRDLPIATFAAIAGLFIAVPGLLAALNTFGGALMWALGNASIDAAAYRTNWHIVFHIYHYIPALTLVGVAYVLVEATADAHSIYAKQLAKALFLLYPIFVPPTFIYHLLVDPSLPQYVKTVGTVLSLLVGVPTLLHTFIILGMLESRMRQAGYGRASWLRHLPWGNPAFSSLTVGFLTLFLGGTMAYLLLQAPLAAMLHNTFFVPAYIHPIAGGGANIIYMGAIYLSLPVLLGRRLWGLRLARVQPYLMGLGLTIMALFGAAAGLAGVPRRYALIAEDAPERWSTLLNISLGIGALLAIAAGVLFVLIIVMTAFAGERVTSADDALADLAPPLLPRLPGPMPTPIALIPSLAFLVVVVSSTYWAFQHLAGLPLQAP